MKINKGRICWMLVCVLLVLIIGTQITFAEDGNSISTVAEIGVLKELTTYETQNETDTETDTATIGSTAYNSELDGQNIQLIGFVANDMAGGYILRSDDSNSTPDICFPVDTVLYITKRHIDDTWALAYIENDSTSYYIKESDIIYTSENSGYVVYTRSSGGGSGGYSSHSGNGWRVTYYGPEPWANGGNTRLANGDSPYDWIGRGVAVPTGSGISLGSTIDVPGHGPMTVVDYGAPPGVIDVLVESESMCN